MLLSVRPATRSRRTNRPLKINALKLPKIKIIDTGDGSHTLFNESLNETYHSVHGALRESQHVFIEHGLQYFASNNPGIRNIRVFEMGFGTGLNAVLVSLFSEKDSLPVEYQGIEAFPVDSEIVNQLNYFEDNPQAKHVFLALHAYPWNEFRQASEVFSFKKIHSKIEDYPLEKGLFHVVFFDAFAPGKQAEVWEVSILQKITDSLCDGGIFVTYCAKGQLKRDLKSLGLDVETLPGPPGKKEMVRAVKRNKPYWE